MAENLSTGVAPTLKQLKNQLSSLYGADGIEELSAIDQQRVGIYINQAYRHCYSPNDGRRPDWAVANYGFELPDAINTDGTLTKGSSTVTLVDAMDGRHVGSYVEIEGEFYTVTEVDGQNISLLNSWTGDSKTTPVTIYHNSYELDREVIDVCDPPEIVGWGRLSPMQGKAQEIAMRASYATDFLPFASQHYGNVPSVTHRGRNHHIDRPLWYYIDSSDLKVYSNTADTTDMSKKAVRSRFTVYPLPSESQVVRLRANILPLELTHDDDVVRLPGNVTWDILFPIASAKLALSDPRYSGDNREALLRLSDEAQARLGSFSSAQKRKPVRLVKRGGW
jgi:hypothetical protein